jgi:hypothetical protein
MKENEINTSSSTYGTEDEFIATFTRLRESDQVAMDLPITDWLRSFFNER